MKKRILFLMTVLFALVCACSLTACALSGGNSGGSDSGSKPKSLTGLEVTVADGSTLNYAGDKVVVQVGEIPAFTKGDFKVSAVYSDGSKKAITDFTFSASAITEDIAPGDYTIEITYKGQTAFITVEVKDAPKESIPSINVNGAHDFEYTGSEIDIIEKLDEGKPENEKLSLLISEGKIILSTEESLDTRTATNVGDYILQIDAAEGYAWKDENDNDTTSAFISWRITKKIVPVPTVTGGKSFEYTGSEIALTIDMHDYDDIITFMNGGTETDRSSYVGLHFCQALIKPEFENSYCFEENASIVDVAQWSITPKSIDYPIITGGYTSIENISGIDYYHFDYTGEAIDVPTSVDDNELFVVERNGSSGIVDASEFSYGVVIDFADSTTKDNYIWADGSSIDTIVFHILVDPIDMILPEEVLSATICAETDYVPGNTYATDNYIELTDETHTLLVESGVWFDDYSTLTYSDEAEYAAGTKTLKFILQTSANYNPIEINIDVTVRKATIAIGSVQWIGTQNTTEGIGANWYDVGEGNFIYNGLAQRKYLSLFYSADYLANEGLQPSVIYDVYYGSEEGVYGVEPVQHVEVPCEGDNWATFDYTAIDTANAGYYKTVATLSIASDNYCFIGDDSEELETIETTWQIEKATLTVYPCYDGTYGVYTDYSYYTGENKTIELDETYTLGNIATYYNTSGTNNYLRSSDGDFELDAFVDIAGISTFVYDSGLETWAEADNTIEVGKYKTVLNATLKEGLATNNYTLIVENKEWSIYDNTFDLSDLQWNNNGPYVYGEGKPTIRGDIPEGLIVSYTDDYNSPYCGGGVGSNRRIATITVDVYADGYEGVTIIKPVSWEYGEDGNSQTCEYVIIGSAIYVLTKKTITIDDFYLLIDNHIVEEPYEIERDGNSHYAYLGHDMQDIGIVYERYDWNSDGYGCLTGQDQVGSYTFSGFVYVSGNYATGDNFAFDENAEYVTLLTEDYEYDGETIIYVDGLSYKYILNFSFTWSIVEPVK